MAITVNLTDDIHTSTIPNYPFQISTLLQNLKKIGRQMPKIESGKEGQTDTMTDGRTPKRTF